MRGRLPMEATRSQPLTPTQPHKGVFQHDPEPEPESAITRRLVDVYHSERTLGAGKTYLQGCLCAGTRAWQGTFLLRYRRTRCSNYRWMESRGKMFVRVTGLTSDRIRSVNESGQAGCWPQDNVPS